jgi:hypothetical protein
MTLIILNNLILFLNLPGGIQCQRACLAHLEARGALSDTFAHPFRTPHS